MDKTGRIQLTWTPGETWRDLVRALNQDQWHILHLVGHGFHSTGQGAFAVAESPGRDHDERTAAFVWPQQIAALMTSTGAWGLVVTAAAGASSTAGLRLLAAEVSALRSAATAHHEAGAGGARAAACSRAPTP